MSSLISLRTRARVPPSFNLQDSFSDDRTSYWRCQIPKKKVIGDANSIPINLHKMWMVFIPFISCLKSNSIAWSPRTFLAPCRQTRFFLANMSTWTWPFVSETKGQPLFSILSQKLHQLLRPVSVEISWPCYQCIHILEIVQKSFIPMKLSLLP